jgi:ferritin
MEITKELTDAINDQINFELYSAFIYLSMAAWFEEHKMPGMGHWMEVQVDEEYNHAMRFYRHIVERGGRVIMKAIHGPQTDWTSPLDIFETAYKHEQVVTERIYKIGDIADKLRDRSAQNMLNWFYNEQTEEEKNTMEIRDQLAMIGENIQALLMLDTKLGARTPAGPVPLTSIMPNPAPAGAP